MGFESSSKLSLTSCTGTNKDRTQRRFRQEKSGNSKKHQGSKKGESENVSSQRLFEKNLKELTDLLVPKCSVNENSVRSKKKYDSK